MKILMVLAIISNIIFPSFNIRRVNNVEIERSWQMQTDTCIIRLPRNVKDFDKDKVRTIFSKGDYVKIDLGVNGVYQREFEGYVTDISADAPIELKLQDEMWKLKKLPVNITMSSATLPKLIAAIAPGYEVDALEIDLGNVRYSTTTVAEVLEKLGSDFGLHSYFQNGKLIVGKIYAGNTAIHNVHLEKGIIKNDLRYLRADERTIKVKAVSSLKSGDKIESEFGDDDGELRQLSFYNITKPGQLKRLAEMEYKRYKVDGYEGSIECWGNITAHHGDKVMLTSDQYPERNGMYYIDRVITKVTDAPMFHKTLSIGKRV